MNEAEWEARLRDKRLLDDGLLDPDQPTETAHRDHVRKMEAEFSPLERRLIRHEILNAH